MSAAPLEDLRSARAAISAWLDATKSSPDPTTQLLTGAKTLNAGLKHAASAIAAEEKYAPELGDWNAEIAQYRASLVELKSQLEHIEIILRMRAANLKRRRVKSDALRSWANLTRNIH